MTIFLGFVGCSSYHAADVSDRSTETTYRGKTHTVSRGETLFSIAWRYGLDYQKLANFNGINPPYKIYPAQKIRLDIDSSGRKNKTDSALVNTPVKDEKKSAGRSSEVKNRSENKTQNANSSSNNPFLSGTPKWQWPAAGKLIAQFQGESSENKGIDLGGKLGEAVLAAASGQVVYAGSGLRGYGNLLIIKHNDIFLSAYAHNHQVLVKEGDFVKAGQRIADMGSSGTDRVKLHFEIRSDGKPVDPLKFLPKR